MGSGNHLGKAVKKKNVVSKRGMVFRQDGEKPGSRAGNVQWLLMQVIISEAFCFTSIT